MRRQCKREEENKLIPESNKRANAKYQSNHIKRLPVNLNDRTDADIIAHLETIDNVQGYVKGLIRADMAKARKDD